MDQGYYGHVRSEIAPLLPTEARRIVDVGCGSGATLAWLRSLYPRAHTIGLEGNSALHETVAGNADTAITVDLASDDIPDLGAPDLMLFLDVLEHLPDPVGALRQLSAGLVPHGVIIVSVPNVAHVSVAVPLIVKGEFRYRDAGILDRTHLRFFTRSTTEALLKEAGFVADQGLMIGIDGPRARLANALTFGAMQKRLAKQYILRGRKGAGSQPISWRVARRKPDLVRIDHGA
jgi:2-polyprenyl-3-methyl-5-hydroxy-6-metoxy-1,4-benzoquinol methylase